jgi:hypothetical protein
MTARITVMSPAQRAHAVGRGEPRLIGPSFVPGAADGDELLQDALLARDQEPVDAPRHVLGRRAQLVLLDREQPVVAHQPAAVAHHVGHVGRLRRVHDL